MAKTMYPAYDFLWRNAIILNASDPNNPYLSRADEKKLNGRVGAYLEKWYAFNRKRPSECRVYKSSCHRLGKMTGARHIQNVYPLDMEDFIVNIYKEIAFKLDIDLRFRNRPLENIKGYEMIKKLRYVEKRPIRNISKKPEI